MLVSFIFFLDRIFINDNNEQSDLIIDLLNFCISEAESMNSYLPEKQIRLRIVRYNE